VTRAPDGSVSIVRRWQLAASVKALREQANLTQDEAVERLQNGQGTGRDRKCRELTTASTTSIRARWGKCSLAT
jgi:hypothetical protein